MRLQIRLSLPVVAGLLAGALLGLFIGIQGKHIPIEHIVQPLRVPGALWVFFSLYWSVAARNSAPVQRSEAVWSTLLHQALLNISLLLLFWRVPGLGDRRFLPVLPALVPIGIAIQVGFMLLAFWARHHLGQNWSGAITAKVDHQLIRSGPYRLIRHPIYTAMLGMTLGTAVTSGEWHAFAGVVLLSIAYYRKIRLEEENMRAVFGPEYEAYCRSSKALIPWML